jgi:3-oxoacyl-[acyl-carrier protein] reductase
MTVPRSALVTGAGAGIGRDIALRLVADGRADFVVINDLDQEKADSVASEIRAAGAEAIGIAADVSSWASVTAMYEKIGDRGVDILINNAGMPPSARRRLHFHETENTDWEPWLSVNVLGVLNVTRLALDGMISRGWGRVIVISSDAGRAGEPGSAAYSASKAGGQGFVRALAKEIGKYGITSNAVSLGAMRHGVAASALQITDEQIEKIARSYPMRRLGENADAAAMVSFVASDDASWITAQTISVNGGYFPS